jgi:tetratricopeptide (TPR) repeat protein
MGLALAKLGRWAEAEDRFRRVLSIDPNHAGGCQGLSTALRQRGQATEALRFARRAARLTEYQNPDVLLTLADTYAEAGRAADAAEAAGRALAAAQASDPKLVPQIRRRLEELRRAKSTPR